MHVLRLVLIGIAIGLAIILGVRFVGNPFAPAPDASRNVPQATPTAANLTPERARALLDQQLKSASEYVRFFKSVQEQFPADYERVADSFADRVKKTGSALSPDIYLAEMLRALRQSHGVLASKASVGMMERVFSHQAAIINALRR